RHDFVFHNNSGLFGSPNYPKSPVLLWKTKSCLVSCPRNHSPRIGPNQPKMLGSWKGETRLIRNILMGSALSLNISGPLCMGLHHKLCLPKETCQLSKVNPT